MRTVCRPGATSRPVVPRLNLATAPADSPSVTRSAATFWLCVGVALLIYGASGYHTDRTSRHPLGWNTYEKLMMAAGAALCVAAFRSRAAVDTTKPEPRPLRLACPSCGHRWVAMGSEGPTGRYIQAG